MHLAAVDTHLSVISSSGRSLSNVEARAIQMQSENWTTAAGEVLENATGNSTLISAPVGMMVRGPRRYLTVDQGEDRDIDRRNGQGTSLRKAEAYPQESSCHPNIGRSPSRTFTFLESQQGHVKCSLICDPYLYRDRRAPSAVYLKGPISVVKRKKILQVQYRVVTEQTSATPNEEALRQTLTNTPTHLQEFILLQKLPPVIDRNRSRIPRALRKRKECSYDETLNIPEELLKQGIEIRENEGDDTREGLNKKRHRKSTLEELEFPLIEHLHIHSTKWLGTLIKDR